MSTESIADANLLATRAMGDKWFAAQASLVLMVPSIVVEVEWNVLINPQHAEFGTMKILQRRSFRFDERMFSSQR